MMEKNQALKDQLEEITSKYVTLQGTHKEREYSFEKLVESHTSLEVTCEVMKNLVESHKPFTHTCTSTQFKVNSFFANSCDSKDKPSWFDQVNVESCDDLISQ
jgi:hypothetical protein